MRCCCSNTFWCWYSSRTICLFSGTVSLLKAAQSCAIDASVTDKLSPTNSWRHSPCFLLYYIYQFQEWCNTTHFPIFNIQLKPIFCKQKSCIITSFSLPGTYSRYLQCRLCLLNISHMCNHIPWIIFIILFHLSAYFLYILW